MLMRGMFCAVALFALFTGCGGSNHVSDCSGNAPLAIARAYAIAVAYPDDLPRFVQENAALFQENGSTMKCATAFITQLRGAAIAGPDPNAVRAQAQDIATRAGRADLGPIVADDMLRSRTDLRFLADHLEALVAVIPDLTRGQTQTYHNTVLYSRMAPVWAQSANLMFAERLENTRMISMQLTEWYVTNLMSAMQ